MSENYVTLSGNDFDGSPRWSFLVHDPAWLYIRRHGDAGIDDILGQLHSIAGFLRHYRGLFCEDAAIEPPPEISRHGTPRACPPYYRIGRHIEDAADLVAEMGYHVGTAVVYCLRAGKKPGQSAESDLRKAADHLLKEADRLATTVES